MLSLVDTMDDRIEALAGFAFRLALLGFLAAVVVANLLTPEPKRDEWPNNNTERPGVARNSAPSIKRIGAFRTLRARSLLDTPGLTSAQAAPDGTTDECGRFV